MNKLSILFLCLLFIGLSKADFSSSDEFYCLNGYTSYNYTTNRYYCQCYIHYYGEYCQYQEDNVTLVYSYQAAPQSGGLVFFYGYFGVSHYNTTVLIGQNYCYVESINDTVIACYLYTYLYDSYYDVQINQNGLMSWYSPYYYRPRDSYICPNNCSGQGQCSSGYCYCYYPWYGYDCSYSNANSSSSEPSASSSSYNPPINYNIICNNTGSAITIESYEYISCTGYGPTTCIDNNSGSQCETDQETGVIKCTTGHKNNTNPYFRHSISCYGNHIECKSSVAQCNIDLQGSFHINNILSTSNLVVFDHQMYEQIKDEIDPSSSSSSSSTLNIIKYLTLSCLLLILLF